MWCITEVVEETTKSEAATRDAVTQLLKFVEALNPPSKRV